MHAQIVKETRINKTAMAIATPSMVKPVLPRRRCRFFTAKVKKFIPLNSPLF